MIRFLAVLLILASALFATYHTAKGGQIRLEWYEHTDKH